MKVSEVIEESIVPIVADVVSFMGTIMPDSSYGRDEIEHMFRCYSEDGQSLVAATDSNSGSGGYVEYIFRYAAEKLLGANIWNDNLDYKVGRNPDISEVFVTSELPDSTNKSLKFVKAYGFRNIQSIMLKMKRGKCDYDLIEVMACPSGCVNGGGQVRGIETPVESKQRIANVDLLMNSSLVSSPDESLLAKFLYCPERLEKPFSKKSIKSMHTRYHAVPKLEELAPLTAKW
jgi:iron only hydrogenase large subunit-like protein